MWNSKEIWRHATFFFLIGLLKRGTGMNKGETDTIGKNERHGKY
jgi:hypothetical protein